MSSGLLDIETLLPTLGPRIVLLVLVAFLLGALPFPLWVGHLVRRVDIRRHGSGNLGATNALRVLGPGWGLLTLLLDIGKGWVAVALAPAVLACGSVGTGSLWPLAAAGAAVLGHLFTPFAGFRGGKGVATSLGTFVALAPWAALIAVLGFVVVVWRWRYVSVGSLSLALSFSAATVFLGPPRPLRLYVVGIGILLTCLIAWRHRSNWARVRAGTEARFSWRSK